MTYTAPLADIRFALREVAGQSEVAALPGYENATEDMIDAKRDDLSRVSDDDLEKRLRRWQGH